MMREKEQAAGQQRQGKQEARRGKRAGSAILFVLTGAVLLAGATSASADSASASASNAHFKTEATLQVFDEPSGGFIVLGGLIHSDKPQCQRDRAERFYRLAGNAEKFLGSAVTNRAGIGTLQLFNYRQGQYVVKVKRKILHDGSVCLATRAQGGLSGARSNTVSLISSRARGWKKCGEFYLVTPRQPILFLTRRLPCIPALEVIAHAIVDPGIIICLEDGCEASGFTCQRPSPSGSVLIRCLSGTGGALEIRASGVKR